MHSEGGGPPGPAPRRGRDRAAPRHSRQFQRIQIYPGRLANLPGYIYSKCPSLVSDVLLSHGLLRSTIGARGLNFRVRNGTGCTSPAMVADQRGAFCCQGPARPGPQGRTARNGTRVTAPDDG